MLVASVLFEYIDRLMISTFEFIAYSIADTTDEYEPYPSFPSALIERIFAFGFCDTISSAIASPCPFPTRTSSINDTRSITFARSDVPVSISAITLSVFTACADVSSTLNAATALSSEVISVSFIIEPSIASSVS